MSTNYAGLYCRLKDTTTSVEDKLKLTKFAWKHEAVYIPNKHQVLVDILASHLINKNKYNIDTTQEDRLWKCFGELLTSHMTSENGTHSLFIKASISQTLIERLSGVKPSLCPGLLLALKTVLSGRFSSIFSSKPDQMISLIGGLCELVLRFGLTRKLLSGEPSFVTLLDLAITAQMSAQHGFLNHNKILQTSCDKLLSPAVRLWAAVRQEPSRYRAEQQRLEGTVSRLTKLLEQLLFHREHIQSYRAYLAIKFGGSSEEKTNLPKAIVHVFTVLEKLTKTRDTIPQELEHENVCGANVLPQTAVCRYLPVFYSAYLSTYRSYEKNISAHKMLIQMITLLGIDLENTAICGPVEEPEVVRGVNQLLQVVQSQDVYDVAEDNSTENVQLKFYKQILNLLLSIPNCRTADWYNCLLLLLRLNHRILEPRLADIFADLLIKDKTCGDLNADHLMTELVSVYAKLRQLPKWISVLLSTFRSAVVPITLSMSPTFSARFGEAVQALAQTVTVDIWRSWVEEVHTHYIPNFSRADFSSASGFEACSILFHHFLANVKVIDYSVTEITARKVNDIMVAMETDLLKPLLTVCSEEKACALLFPSLLLCHGWGELRLLMCRYTSCGNRDPDPAQTGPTSQSSDLSLVHTYLKPKMWKKIEQDIVKGDNCRLKFIRWCLVLQNLRLDLLRSSVHGPIKDSDIDGPMKDADIHGPMKDSVIMDWSSLFSQLSGGDRQTAWDGNFQSIRGDNYIIALWDVIVHKLPIFVSVLPDTSFKFLADYAVRTRDGGTGEDLESMKTLQSVSRELMTSQTLVESVKLQHAIVTSVWYQAREIFAPRRKSPKKRKSCELSCLMLKVLDGLGTDDTNVNVMPEVLRETATLVNQIMSSTGPGLSGVWSRDQIHRHINTLLCLPLESLETTDQLRCVFGLIVSLTICMEITDVLPSEASRDQIDPVISSCIQTLAVLLESGSTSLFQLLDVEAYLNWLLRLHSRTSGKAELESRTSLVMELSVLTLTRDGQNLPRLKNLITQTDGDEDVLLNASRLKLYICLSAEVGKLLRWQSVKHNNSQLLVLMKSLVDVAHNILHSCRLSDRDWKESRLLPSAVGIYSNVPPNLGLQHAEDFNLAFTWSCHCLETMETEQERESVENKMTALGFLHTFCRDYKLQADIFTDDKKLVTWTLLKSCLPRLAAVSLAVVDGVIHENDCDDIMMKNSLRHFSGPSEDEVSKSESDQAKSTKSVSLYEKTVRTNSSKDWWSLRKHSNYHGNLETNGSEILLMQSQNVMAGLMVSFSAEQYSRAVRGVCEDIDPANLICHTQKIQSSILVLQHLLSCDLSEDQCSVLAQLLPTVMCNLQCVMEELSHSRDPALVSSLAVRSLHLQSELLSSGMNLISPRNIVLSLHSCLLIPLEGTSMILAFHAVYEVLNALLVHHASDVLSVIPSFLACAKRLLKVVMLEGSQNRVPPLCDETELIGCAHLIERLFSLIATQKVDFSKVAAYVVADYVTNSQQATLLPCIKKSLLPGIYKMLDLCDTHSVAQLHTVLEDGVRDVFKILYSDYAKYYRYTGKV